MQRSVLLNVQLSCAERERKRGKHGCQFVIRILGSSAFFALRTIDLEHQSRFTYNYFSQMLKVKMFILVHLFLYSIHIYQSNENSINLFYFAMDMDMLYFYCTIKTGEEFKLNSFKIGQA